MENILKSIREEKSLILNENELKKLRFNLNDLMEQLRISGCPDISNVRAAVVETNGQLSVLEKKKDASSGLPYLLISDGEVNKNELKRAGKNMKWLRENVKCPTGEVFSAMLDEKNQLHIQRKGEKDKK